MKRQLHIFLLYFQSAFHQRARSFVWFLLAFLNPLLLLVYWIGAYKNKHMAIPNWSFSSVTSYYLLLIIAGSFLIAHIEEEIAIIDVKEGFLTKYLLQPFSYYWIKFHQELPWRIVQGVFGIITFIIFSLIFGKVAALSNNIDIIMLSVIIICLGFFLSFTCKMTIGLSALWVTDFWGIQQVFEILILIFAGFIVPVDIFPPLLRIIAFLTPFPYMVYYPLVALQGKYFAFQLVQIIILQIVWLIILVGFYRLLWRKGIHKFTGVGQ